MQPSATPTERTAGVPLAWNARKGFCMTLSVILTTLIAAFAAFTRYDSQPQIKQSYLNYGHVAVMVLVGFGFIIPFLKSYSMSAVSLNLVASCIAMLAYILLVRPGLGSFQGASIVSTSCNLVWQSWCQLNAQCRLQLQARVGPEATCAQMQL